MTRHLFILFILLGLSFSAIAQRSACSDPSFRYFDFWIGQWEVFGKNNKKAGDSHISLILDSCVILEEWVSANPQNGLTYQGKSFNSYNAATKQWQQTWVDNTGNTTEYLRGTASSQQVIFYADNVTDVNGKKMIRRLTFTKLSENKVRQWGEKSEDGGNTWATEYDLEYRRK